MTKTILAVAGILASTAPLAAQPLVAHFESSAAGWTVETRSNPAGAFSFISTFTPDFVPTGGDTGGYVEELDPDPNWSFFRAPQSWAGDRSALLGRRLLYSIRTNVVDYPDGRLVVLIAENGQTISHATDLPPTNNWVRRSIPLAQGAWHVGASATGATATESQIAGVLGSLSRVLIGMEFGADLLEERVGLDRVVLGACDADFNADGQVNSQDFFDFLAAFFANDPAADFNADDQINSQDFFDFLAAFFQGCD